jgi:proteasome lid subunit RPN8/RPN11
VSLGNEADVRNEVGLDGEYFRRLGCWHSHPNGEATPSTADMDAWAQYLWARDRQCVFEYLSIIVTPGSGGLAPEFHGWVTHGQRGRYVCQPAALSDRLGYCS